MANPVGTITLWSGDIVDIPVGWQLCDGTNGTPNLKQRFVVGAGGTYDPDEVGGESEHDHEVDDLGHSHEFHDGDHHHDAKATNACAGSGPDTVWSGDSGNDQTEDSQVDGDTDWSFPSCTTEKADNFPPFYALAYIQRMV